MPTSSYLQTIYEEKKNKKNQRAISGAPEKNASYCQTQWPELDSDLEFTLYSKQLSKGSDPWLILTVPSCWVE